MGDELEKLQAQIDKINPKVAEHTNQIQQSRKLLSETESTTTSSSLPQEVISTTEKKLQEILKMRNQLNEIESYIIGTQKVFEPMYRLLQTNNMVQQLLSNITEIDDVSNAHVAHIELAKQMLQKQKTALQSIRKVSEEFKLLSDEHGKATVQLQDLSQSVEKELLEAKNNALVVENEKKINQAISEYESDEERTIKNFKEGENVLNKQLEEVKLSLQRLKQFIMHDKPYLSIEELQLDIKDLTEQLNEYEKVGKEISALQKKVTKQINFQKQQATALQARFDKIKKSSADLKLEQSFELKEQLLESSIQSLVQLQEVTNKLYEEAKNKNLNISQEIKILQASTKNIEEVEKLKGQEVEIIKQIEEEDAKSHQLQQQALEKAEEFNAFVYQTKEKVESLKQEILKVRNLEGANF
jgi:hypothetical protein